MLRNTLITVAVLLTAGSAPAFYLFLAPRVAGDSQLALAAGDRPHADEIIETGPFAAAKLQFLDADGKLSAATFDVSPGALLCPKATPGRVVAVLATCEYGVVTRGGPPVFVVHHAKHVARPSGNPTVGDPDRQRAGIVTAIAGMPLEISPVADGSELKFRVTTDGKPRDGLDVQVLVPGEKIARVVKTDATGTTPAFAPNGEYAVKCSWSAATDGEFVGRKYKTVRHYATLVTTW